MEENGTNMMSKTMDISSSQLKLSGTFHVGMHGVVRAVMEMNICVLQLNENNSLLQPRVLN